MSPSEHVVDLHQRAVSAVAHVFGELEQIRKLSVQRCRDVCQFLDGRHGDTAFKLADHFCRRASVVGEFFLGQIQLQAKISDFESEPFSDGAACFHAANLDRD